MNAVVPHLAAATRCAVFDLDGTLHPGNLACSLLEALVDEGLCGAQSAGRFLDYLSNLGSQELVAPGARRTAYDLYGAALQGISAEDVQRVAKDVWQHKRNTIFECMHPLIAAVAAHGYDLVLISGSPEEIVREVAVDLRVAHYQGAVLGQHNGIYNGRVVWAPGIYGTKLDVLAELLADVSLDLRGSMAIGNAANDIEVLSAVGFPIAFEPSAPLRAAAIRSGWPITDRNTPASTFVQATVGREADYDYSSVHYATVAAESEPA